MLSAGSMSTGITCLPAFFLGNYEASEKLRTRKTAEIVVN